MLSRVIWVLVLTGVSVFATGWWLGWDFSGKSFNFDFLNQAVEEVGTDISITSLGDAAKSGGQVIQQGFGKAVERQKLAALGTLSEITGSLVSGAKEQTASAIKSFDKVIGLGLIGDSDLESSSLVLVVAARANEPVSFLIQSNSSFTRSYLIDWGDGQESKGFLGAKEETIVKHAWDSVGDYIITFNSNQLLVRVIN